jgi:hypothetical protein
MMDQAGTLLEDHLPSLFQPDILLSAQYFDNFRRQRVLEPEKDLMLAILEDAVRCFQDNVLAQERRKKALFDEAEEWILETDRDWIFSFESVCETLGLDPRAVRQALLRLKRKTSGRDRPPKAA